MHSKEASSNQAERPDAIPGGRYDFSSDNTSAICPEAWEEMERANNAAAPSYGNDDWTGRASESIRLVFDTGCDVFLVFSGTAANALALSSICRSHHAIVVHENAHASVDECSAPEFFTGGAKLLTVSGEGAKLTPAAVDAVIRRRNDLHFPKVRALSLTNATEHGTVYSPAEVRALTSLAHSNGMCVHMDGARFANAVASTGAHPSELTWRAGVDVLCFGGTKNGMSTCEAVVFFNRDLAVEFEYRCKQAGQLASKMRFAAAQWAGALDTGAWLRHATHANACARELAARLGAIPGARILLPVDANAVFVELAPSVAAALRAKGWFFYPFIGDHGYRLMCSWATRDEAIDELLADVREASGK